MSKGQVWFPLFLSEKTILNNDIYSFCVGKGVTPGLSKFVVCTDEIDYIKAEDSCVCFCLTVCLSV